MQLRVLSRRKSVDLARQASYPSRRLQNTLQPALGSIVIRRRSESVGWEPVCGETRQPRTAQLASKLDHRRFE